MIEAQKAIINKPQQLYKTLSEYELTSWAFKQIDKIKNKFDLSIAKCLRLLQDLNWQH